MVLPRKQTRIDRKDAYALVREYVLSLPQNEDIPLRATRIAFDLAEAGNHRFSTRQISVALMLLITEGLLKVRPGIGITVNSPSLSDVSCLIISCAGFEAVSAYYLSQKEDKALRIKRLWRLNKALGKIVSPIGVELKSRTQLEFRDLDIEFHAELLRQAEFKASIDVLNVFRARLASAMVYSFLNRSNCEAIIKEHDNILEAILKCPIGSATGELLIGRQKIEVSLELHIRNTVCRSLENFYALPQCNPLSTSLISSSL